MKKIWIIVVIGLVLFGTSLGVSIPELQKATVAKIPIKGTISQGSYSAGPTAISKNIGKASSNPLVKAFVFTINSPGGSVVASKQIMKSIREINKPTICKIEDIGASGAYWAATGCDKIVSDSLSMAGGIGVTASYLEYSGLFKKYGVDYEKLVSGEFKDMGTPYRNLTPEERGDMMDKINTIHKSFVRSVSKNRGLNYSYVKNISDGKVYLGSRAKELGLVDCLGGNEKVKKLLKEELNKEIRFEYYRKDVSFLQMFSQLSGENSQLSEKGKIINSLLSKKIKNPKLK